MPVVIYKGQNLTKDDLNIFIQDQDGVYFNPFSITYTIYRVISDQFRNQECGEEPILETIDLLPLPFGIGKFFAAWEQAHDLGVGSYRIKWNIARFSDSSLTEYIEDFEIVNRIDRMNYSAVNDGSGGKLPHQQWGNSTLCAG
ncbi:MAG: hypothetical protein PHF86_04245 [Candidatus Nanoarchaeia archaeon]|jgi:hypothetical protein|nr:hypothetical protein [Candidatus Nanoarchaeia archaeon]